MEYINETNFSKMEIPKFLKYFFSGIVSALGITIFLFHTKKKDKRIVEHNKNSILFILPKDLLQLCFQYLSTNELILLETVSKSINKLVNHPLSWKYEPLTIGKEWASLKKATKLLPLVRQVDFGYFSNDFIDSKELIEEWNILMKQTFPKWKFQNF